MKKFYLADEWEMFKAMYGKQYSNPTEEALRKDIFLKEKRQIDRHNKEADEGLHSSYWGINEFSDWLPSELDRLCGEEPLPPRVGTDEDKPSSEKIKS